VEHFRDVVKQWGVIDWMSRAVSGRDIRVPTYGKLTRADHEVLLEQTHQVQQVVAREPARDHDRHQQRKYEGE
jgi:hypothetical protein